MSARSWKWGLIGAAAVSWAAFTVAGTVSVTTHRISGYDWSLLFTAAVAVTCAVAVLVSCAVSASLPEPLAAFLLGRHHPYSDHEASPEKRLSVVRNKD